MNTERLQPIDRLAIALITLLALIMGLLIWGNSACDRNCLFHSGARVSDFNWQNQTIGREDRAFVLSFNRPMNRDSVEQNLTITPALPGKISWSGLRLAYTLKSPAPYGETYQVSLAGATDRLSDQKQPGKTIEPFEGEFRSRDRAFAYIGTQGVEKGKLILYNWTQQQSQILTPDNLTVFDFEPYPQGDRILFSAADSQLGSKGIQNLQLYRVDTGLNAKPANNLRVELILDNQKYQNNKFDLARNGQTIVVQRLNRDNPVEYGLWMIVDNQPPQLITDDQIGDFLIAPDSQTVAVAQGEGIALLPLEADAEPLDFLPRFGQVLDFTADGTGAAMIDYNTDNAKLRYTRSLFYVNNQGIQQELLNTDGSIQNCQFDPTATHLYCWLTELAAGEEYIEKPYIAEIDLKTKQAKTIVSLAEYQDSKLSIAPDGLGILFERSLKNAVIDFESNKSIWLLIPSGTQADSIYNAEKLPFIGFHPQWLP
ncbi:MAG: Ig-like domain-containing protein [Pleurocapsa sp.]